MLRSPRAQQPPTLPILVAPTGTHPGPEQLRPPPSPLSRLPCVPPRDPPAPVFRVLCLLGAVPRGPGVDFQLSTQTTGLCTAVWAFLLRAQHRVAG